MGRRWGKTLLAGATSLVCANDGAKVGWIVPTYKNARPVWRFALALLANARRYVRISESNRTIEFGSGGSVGIYSADNPVSILGEDFDLVILEEAARIREEVWTETVLPTLSDRDGRALLISTPRGRNWYWREYMRGKRGEACYASFTAPTSDNPLPNIQKAFRLARERVTARVFAQEWLAEFLTDGSFFENVDAVCSVKKPDPVSAHTDHEIVAGIDWGKQNDKTVALFFCRECGRAVDWYAKTGVRYEDQRAVIIDLSRKWNVSGVLPERNSIGEPNIELLLEADVPVVMGQDGKRGFFTSASSKAKMIEMLELELQRKSIALPEEAASEFASFEIQQRPMGPAHYSAPDGDHDDWVIASGLAVYLASQRVQIFS